MIVNKDEEKPAKNVETEELLEKPTLENLARINDTIASSIFLINKRAKISTQCLKEEVSYGCMTFGK